MIAVAALAGCGVMKPKSPSAPPIPVVYLVFFHERLRPRWSSIRRPNG